jgi:hypothetical protein
LLPTLFPVNTVSRKPHIVFEVNVRSCLSCVASNDEHHIFEYHGFMFEAGGKGGASRPLPPSFAIRGRPYIIHPTTEGFFKRMPAN